MKVGFYKNMTVKGGYIFEVDKILEAIKAGNWADQVLEYRETGDQSIKDNLPAFTVGGVFSPTKSISNLQTASGLLSLDIDDYQKDRGTLMGILKGTLGSSFYSLFQSTGGKGYCALVKIKKFRDYDHYKMIYEDVYQHLVGNTDLSSTSKFDYLPNLNRLRFVSYDPDLYLNTNPTEWTGERELPIEEYIPDRVSPQKIVIKGGLSDEEKLEEVLSRYVSFAGEFGASKTRHDWVLGLARWACRADIDDSFLTNYILVHYDNSSRPSVWPSEVRRCVRDSYRAYQGQRGTLEPTKKFSYDDIQGCKNGEEVREQLYLLIIDKENFYESQEKKSTFLKKEIDFLKKLSMFVG